MTRFPPVQLPEHIAIIMDGNGRWATNRRLPRTAGHKAGVKALRKIVEHCVTRKITILTVYAFSSENWRRPEQEVNLLMELFMSSLKREVKNLHENNVSLIFIGDRNGFPDKLQKEMARAESLTAKNNGLCLVIAANYGGRWDISSSCRKIAQQVVQGDIDIDAINEKLIDRNLCTTELSDPDLFIRTGGEQRVSNYLLWQLAYTEMYFTDVLWPDFDTQHLDLAIAWFAERQRRFGRTSEQVKQSSA